MWCIYVYMYNLYIYINIYIYINLFHFHASVLPSPSNKRAQVEWSLQLEDLRVFDDRRKRSISLGDKESHSLPRARRVSLSEHDNAGLCQSQEERRGGGGGVGVSNSGSIVFLVVDSRANQKNSWQIHVWYITSVALATRCRIISF